MATISKLVVSLEANSSKLTSALGKTQKRAKAWAKSVAGSVKSISKAFAALGTVAIGGFILAVNKSAAAIDTITKAASKLNFPIEDYQRFAFIASKSNIPMDNFGKSMQRMAKSIGDSRDGLSTATKAFDQLGLSADDLAKMNPSQQFEAIAAGMDNVATHSDKVKIAMDIFGRSGADLLNVFAGDVKGIGKEFDSLGVTITSQQAAMVAEYQDAKTTLTALFGGFAKNVTAEIAPAFTRVIEWITESIKEMGGMKVAASRFAQFVIRGMVGAVKGLIGFVDGISSMRLAMIDIQAVWKKTIAVLKLKPFAKESFAEQLKSVEAEIDSLIDKRLSIELEIANRAKIEGTLERLEGELQSLISGAGAASSNSSKGSNVTVKNKDGTIDFVASAKARLAAEQELTQETQGASTSLQELAKSAKEAASAGEKGQVSDQFKKYFEMAQRDLTTGSIFADSKINVLQDLLKSAISPNINYNGENVSPADIALMQSMLQDVLTQKELLNGENTTAQAIQELTRINDDTKTINQVASDTSKQTLTSSGLIATNTAGIQSLMSRLLDVASKPLEKVGEITLNIVSANGGGKFNLQGDPEILLQIKDMVETLTNNATRQAAQ